MNQYVVRLPLVVIFPVLSVWFMGGGNGEGILLGWDGGLVMDRFLITVDVLCEGFPMIQGLVVDIDITIM